MAGMLQSGVHSLSCFMEGSCAVEGVAARDAGLVRLATPLAEFGAAAYGLRERLP